MNNSTEGLAIACALSRWIPKIMLVFCPMVLSIGSPLLVSAGELRSSGYVPIREAEFASFPKVKHYRAFLPPSVDLSGHFPTPGDQGRLGACTAWAVGYAARSYYAESVEGRQRNSNKDIPSPSFIYNSTRDPDNCEGGSNFPAVLGLLENGALSLADYPYNTSCKLPDQKQKAAATDFRIEGFLGVALKNIDDVKGELARGNPVMFGMMADESLEQLRGAQVYTVAGPGNPPYPHAMTVVGYDESNQAFRIINSWGTVWGDGGFGWIAYDTFSSQAREAYVMQLSRVAPTPKPKPVVVVTVPPMPLPEPKPSPPVVKPSEPLPKPVVKPPIVVQTVPPVVQEPVVDSDCSKVVSATIGDKTVISGFVGTEAALEQVRKEHQGSKEKFEVQFRPWPQCEVLMTLERALSSADKPRLVTLSGQTTFKKADQMALTVRAPKRPSYIYVSYVQADGSVFHLEQPAEHAGAPSLSDTEYLFGDGLEGRQKFTASVPFGHEMVVVVASASPLFDKELPAMQTEREYLSMLRKAVIYKVDPKMPDREISAAFLGIETKEK